MLKFILFILIAFTLSTTFIGCSEEEVKPQTQTSPGGGASDSKG